MDILPSGNIFRELQDIHDTGYFSSQVSIEDQWQQASHSVYNHFYHRNSVGIQCDFVEFFSISMSLEHDSTIVIFAFNTYFHELDTLSMIAFDWFDKRKKIGKSIVYFLIHSKPI